MGDEDAADGCQPWWLDHSAKAEKCHVLRAWGPFQTSGVPQVSGPLLLGVVFLIPDPVWESKGMSHGCWAEEAHWGSAHSQDFLVL